MRHRPTLKGVLLLLLHQSLLLPLFPGHSNSLMVSAFRQPPELMHADAPLPLPDQPSPSPYPLWSWFSPRRAPGPPGGNLRAEGPSGNLTFQRDEEDPSPSGSRPPSGMPGRGDRKGKRKKQTFFSALQWWGPNYDSDTQGEKLTLADLYEAASFSRPRSEQAGLVQYLFELEDSEGQQKGVDRVTEIVGEALKTMRDDIEGDLDEALKKECEDCEPLKEKVTALENENAELKPLKEKVTTLEKEITELKKQLENQKCEVEEDREETIGGETVKLASKGTIWPEAFSSVVDRLKTCEDEKGNLREGARMDGETLKLVPSSLLDLINKDKGEEEKWKEEEGKMTPETTYKDGAKEILQKMPSWEADIKASCNTKTKDPIFKLKDDRNSEQLVAADTTWEDATLKLADDLRACKDESTMEKPIYAKADDESSDVWVPAPDSYKHAAEKLTEDLRECKKESQMLEPITSVEGDSNSKVWVPAPKSFSEASKDLTTLLRSCEREKELSAYLDQPTYEQIPEPILVLANEDTNENAHLLPPSEKKTKLKIAMNNVLAVIPAWEKDIRGSCRVNFKSSPADKIMYCGYKWWAKDNGISGPLGSIALSAASSSDPFIFKTKQYDSPDPAVYWADDDYSQGWAKAAALFMSMERRVWDMPNSFEDFCLDEFEKVSSTGEGLVSHLKYSDKGASLSVQEQVQASIDVGGPTGDYLGAEQVLYCGLRWWSLSQTSTAGSLSDSATLKSGAKFFFHLKAYQPSGSGAWGTTANAKDWSKMAALMMAVERLVAQMPREHEHYCDSDFGSVSKQGRKIVRALSFSTRTKGTGSPEENMFNDFFKQKNERGPQNNPVCRFYTTQSLAREEGKQCREYRIKMEKTVSASGWKAGVQSSQKQSQS